MSLITPIHQTAGAEGNLRQTAQQLTRLTKSDEAAVCLASAPAPGNKAASKSMHTYACDTKRYAPVLHNHSWPYVLPCPEGFAGGTRSHHIARHVLKDLTPPTARVPRFKYFNIIHWLCLFLAFVDHPGPKPGTCNHDQVSLPAQCCQSKDLKTVSNAKAAYGWAMEYIWPGIAQECGMRTDQARPFQ
jgi:hypothetical protein